MTSELDTVRALLEAARGGEEQSPSIDEMRAGYDQTGQNMPLPEGVRIERTMLASISCERHTPANLEGDRTILYLHGGGYVVGSPTSHRGLVAQLAKASASTVYALDYKLAPEAPYPGAVEDAMAAYKQLIERIAPASKIIFAGDSAGGGLTLATAVYLKSKGLPQPAGLMALSPWVNLTNTGWSYQSKGKIDIMLQHDRLEEMARAYAGSHSRLEPLISPAKADLKGIAPLFIQAGGDEILLSDATLLAERAGAASVPVNLEIWPEMPHVFQYFYPFLTPAREAIARLGGFAKAHAS